VVVGRLRSKASNRAARVCSSVCEGGSVVVLVRREDPKGCPFPFQSELGLLVLEVPVNGIVSCEDEESMVLPLVVVLRRPRKNTVGVHSFYI
jgi:hypothetical protein